MPGSLPPLLDPLVVRLRGSQAEMGRQFGEVTAATGGHHGALGLYLGPPTMAARVLAAGFPYRSRAAAERIADAVLGLQRRRLDARRRRQFPELATRTEAAFREVGVDPRDTAAVFVMDVLQNAVGLVSRTGMFDRGAHAAVPSCSSLAVWGSATIDGELRHARNFDFPGAAVWDLAPEVVLCDPTDGLRSGFVTTRGVDAPGITCFNEAGLTLTVHTRFHRDVRFDAPSVIDLGHEIIRTSRTLDQAVATARRLGSASTWGLLVSSAEERSAVVVELTGSAVAVVEPAEEATHLSCTNRYLDPALRIGEVTTSPSFAVDSDSRFAQLEAFVAKHAGGIDTDALEELLGDLGAPGLVDRTDDVERLTGPSVVSSVSVASVVSEPERGAIAVSIGRAPTGFGPYLRVPWAWDGEVGVVADAFEVGPVRGRSYGGAPLTERQRELAHRISAVTQGALDREAPHIVRSEVEDLCALAPTEPGLATFAAILAAVDGETATAARHLDRALALEGTPALRDRLLELRDEVGRAATSPSARRRLRLRSLDVMLLDLHA